MGEAITITLAGEPVGKGRPRYSSKNGSFYTPAKTRAFETALALAAKALMRSRRPFDGPVAIHVVARFSIPKSWSKAKRRDANLGILRPTGKPDADNILKAIDALNKIVWRDDSQIVRAEVEKYYSFAPLLWIRVKPIAAEYDADDDTRESVRQGLLAVKERINSGGNPWPLSSASEQGSDR